MSASTYEYKTVAMPQTVQGKRKRGTSEADLVAETFGEVIHLEAVEGWEYMRADVLAAGTRGGMFSKEPTITYYSVLVFRRTTEAAWPMHQPQERPAQERKTAPAASSAPPPPSAPAAPARREQSAPVIDASPPMPSAPVRPRPAPVAPRSPLPSPSPAPAASPKSEPRSSSLSGIADPTSPLAQGMMLTTGGQLDAGSGSFSDGSAPAPSPAPRASPRPPLGSAQD